MSSGRKEKLDHTLAALEAQYGAGTLKRAKEIVHMVPHLSTGFATLDALTGCGGVPLDATTLLSGVSTSGKLTIAYKTIAGTQKTYPKQVAALIDLHGTADPDYLSRAGVDMSRLLLVRPTIDKQAVDVLIDLANTRKVRLIVVNCLADLQSQRLVYRHLTATLGRLQQALRATNSALLWIDDPSAPWLCWFNLDNSKSVRQFVSLHIEMQHEQWLTNKAGVVCGYIARAKLHKSKWTKAGRTATIDIEFNGTIKARQTW